MISDYICFLLLHMYNLFHYKMYIPEYIIFMNYLQAISALEIPSQT
jgi:hypothetical protein